MRRNNYSRRAPKTLGAAAVIAVCLLAPPLAEAVPVFINGTNVWRADRTPNPIGFVATALVPWIQVTTDSSGDVTQTVVTASNSGTTFNLNRIATGLFSGTYFAQIPYDETLTGPWTITATNGGNSVSTTRPAFVPVEAMPFVADIGFTGTGTDITVHWTVTPEGESRLDEQQVAIWDLSTNAAPTPVQFFGIGAADRQVHLNALTLGTTYAVEINNVERNAVTHFIDVFSGNWLNGWIATEGGVKLPTPVPEPTTLSLLLVGLASAGLLRRRRAAKTA